MVYAFYPSSPELPPQLHDLRDECIKLRQTKRTLKEINKALLDPTIPVCMIHPPSSKPFRPWEVEAWDNFYKMSAQEKRPVVEKGCRGRIEEVSMMLMMKTIADRPASAARR